MGELHVEVEPEEVGLDPERLARIDRHFARYVDEGYLPGWQLLVARQGRIAHLSTYGFRDREAELPVESDTVFRIYSMTKPITSVAAMMLWEEGAFELKDPVSRWLPAFADLRVYRSGSAQAPLTEPAREPLRVWHLLTHLSGLTYGFHNSHVTDAIYRANGFEWGAPKGWDLATCCDAWAALPLVGHPGERWNYSVSTDVLGRLVEVVSGQSLDRFFAERIFGPLGMHDTGFGLPDEQRSRLAGLYVAGGDRKAFRYDEFDPVTTGVPTFLSGGGGLVSTALDYHRFAQMLLRRGELDGVRVLGDRTVRYMTQNHLPGGVDLEAIGTHTFSETTFDGIGFGLGFSVNVDPVANKVPGSVGEFAWGGAASTGFWVDPVEELTGVFMTQLLPSSTHPLRPQFKQMVHQALLP